MPGAVIGRGDRSRRPRFGGIRAAAAVRQPQLGVQNPNGRPEQVIKACRSPLIIKRMNQTHHRGSLRAQNRHFCALFAFGTPVFGPFEHKNWLFVRFWSTFPRFWHLPSTKSAFLCSGRVENGIGKRKSELPAIHQGQTAASSGTQHLHPARRQPH